MAAASEDQDYYAAAKDAEDRNKYYGQWSDLQHVNLNELKDLLSRTHVHQLDYQPSTFLYPDVDLHPDGRLRSIYSNLPYEVEELVAADRQIDQQRVKQLADWALRLKISPGLASERFRAEVESLLPYNCEHVVCQSWFDKKMPMRGDLHHLFACESTCNSFRNNSPYTDFPDYQPPPSKPEDKERLRCGFSAEGLFEPEHNKGVVARAVLYFQVRYAGIISIYGNKEMEMLKQWSSDQPVTTYERHRNQVIFRLQGNRNPFIDFDMNSSFLVF